MKIINRKNCGIGILVLFCLLTNLSWAQKKDTSGKDMEAKRILDKVSAKYNNYLEIQVSFDYLLENKEANIKELQSGKMQTVPSKNMYHIELGNIHIYSNGQSKWIHMVDDKTVQLTEVDPTDKDVLSPSKILTFYKKGYKYIYLDNDVINKHKMYILELTPENEDDQMFKIKLWVNQNTSIIEQVKFFEKSGNQYTYTIKKFDGKKKYNPKDYVFDTKKYYYVELEDLR